MKEFADVLSGVLTACYWIVVASVLARAVLMLISWGKAAPDQRSKNLPLLGLSVLAEAAWCALVKLSFSLYNLSNVNFLPLVLSILGLMALRRIAPFEKVASRYVYSLLVAFLPQRKESLTKAIGLHLF